jgi:hypothetical protein
MKSFVVRGYGVGTRTGWARMVPASSRTVALIPPPPQSMARVEAVGSSALTRQQCAVSDHDRVT